MTDNKDRIKELKDNIFALQCSDDRLYTNGNGNLSYLRSMEKELAELTRDDNANTNHNAG